MKRLLLLILVCLPSVIFSQGMNRKSEFSPATPNSAEILKRGLIPLNQYNGLPNINLPIYSFNFDGKEIPLSLSYNAGGLRPSQEASWVGLGWSLMAQPTITRAINQHSDIGSQKLENSPGNTGYCFGDVVPSFVTSGSSFVTTLENYSYGPAYSTMDTQPDIFTANLYGETVKFILTQKAVNGTIEAKIINGSIAKVNYIEATRVFEIIDSEGFKYVFDQKEYVTNFSESSTNKNIDDIYTLQNGHWYDGLDRELITSWMVGKIESPNNKELDFVYYGENTAPINADGINDIHISISPTQVFESKTLAYCQGGNIYPDGSAKVYSYQRSAQENKYLKEIVDVSTGKRIFFKVADREDIKKFDPFEHSNTVAYIYGSTRDSHDHPKKLVGIEVFSNTGKRVKKVLFDQSYFNGHKLADPNKDNYLRLKLDQVTIDNANYDFYYHLPDSLPTKNTSAVDFWGFYSGDTSGNRIPTHFLDNTYPIGDCNGLEWPVAGQLIQAGNKGSHFESARIGILNKIVYPTGGFTEFEYEGNTAKVSSNSSSVYYSKYTSMYLEHNNREASAGFPYSSSTESGTKTYAVGGLRVKSIMNRDFDGSLLLKKSYRYDGFDGSAIPMSSGKLMNELFYYYPNYSHDLNGNIIGTALVASSTNKVYGNFSAQGSHIGYSFVEETVVNADNTSEDNGRIVTEFINRPNAALQTTYNGDLSWDAPSRHFEEANGKILSQKIYSNVFGSTPKREITNTYSEFSGWVANALKAYYSNMRGSIIGSQGGSAGIPIDWKILYSRLNYSVYRTYALLATSSVKDYFDDGSFTERFTSNTYNTYPQITSSSLTDSRGNDILTEYYYPYNTDYGVDSHPRMSALVGANRIGSPVYTRNYYNGQLTGHELISYDYFSGNLLPSAISYQRGDGPLASMEQRLEYLDYDENANPTEVSQDSGPGVAYLWGYEKEYPVAKVVNIESSDTPIEDIIDQDVIDNPLSAESSYESELDKIRTHADYQNAMVYTYTHEPLVGLKSISSERGYTNFFEYDSRERLVRTKDEEKSIINDIGYSLNNEDVDCLNCVEELTLTTDKYQIYDLETVTINYSIVPGFGTISEWYIDYGDGTFDVGTGSPPANFSHTYQGIGLKPIRLFLTNSSGESISGNVNVRLYPGTTPGGDVYFGNINQSSSNSTATTARIYGDVGAVITYTVQIGGDSQIFDGTGSVDGYSNQVSGSQSVQNTVTIPAGGYVDCSVQTFNPNGANGTVTTVININSTSIGQVAGGPSTISHTYSN